MSGAIFFLLFNGVIFIITIRLIVFLSLFMITKYIRVIIDVFPCIFITKWMTKNIGEVAIEWK